MEEVHADQARAWLEALRTGRTSALLLAPDFTYSGFFGRAEQVDVRAVARLLSRWRERKVVLRDVVEIRDQAAIRYDIATRTGWMRACDWIVLEGPRLQRVESFHAAQSCLAALRRTELAEDEGRGAIW